MGGTTDRSVRPCGLTGFFVEDEMAGDRMHEALERIEQVRADALHAINEANTTTDLEATRVRFAGKKSALQQVLSDMMPVLKEPQARKQLGLAVNTAKEEIEHALMERAEEL